MAKRRITNTGKLTQLGGVAPGALAPQKYSKKPGGSAPLYKRGQMIPGGRTRQTS